MTLSGDMITSADVADATRAADADPAPASALTAVLVDPAAGPADLDAVAAGHPDLWLPATLLSAIRRIAAGDDDPGIADVLHSVVDDHGEHDVESALGVLQRLPPSTDVAVARIGLFCTAGRHGAVLALTHGLVGVDDRTALSLVYRATSLASVGLWETARVTFATVLRRRWHGAVRDFARRQRAETIGG